MRLKALILITALLIAPIVQAVDPQPYTVHIESTGHSALDSALKGSSQLLSLRTTAPAGPFALVGRAEGDVERLQTVLESFGYYQAHISVSIAGRALDDAGVREAIEALPAGSHAPVLITIETGPLYHLGRVSIEGEVSASARSAFALQSGQPAVASAVLAAGQRLLDAIQEEGHAFAKVDEPIAYQDAHDPLLDVSFKVTAGPVYRIGAIHFEGQKRMHESFLQKRLKLRPADAYSPGKIERARTDLLALGTFSGVSVRLPKEGEFQGGNLPVTFDVQERKRHAVSLTAQYSSDLGGSGGATWTDRNLLGNAEQLSLSASLINAGGSDTTGVGYDLGAQLTKPDFLRNDQSLVFSLSALQQNLIAYDQTAQLGGVSVSRRLGSKWIVSVGATLEKEKILQQGVHRYYTLVAIPVTAKYDSTALANPLNDPLHGVRASMTLAPTESLPSSGNNSENSGDNAVKSRRSDATFVIFQITASTYLDLARFNWSAPGRSVIALRGLVAEAHGAGQFSLPPDQRFYGGGSATVRGYQFQSVGPTFANPVTGPPPATPIPTGGTDLVAAGIEFRQRLGTNFGTAVFVDAGKVTTDPHPFEGRPSVGYGAGLRYYTPIGPIRLDVAAPVRKLPGGASIEVYVGLGQAF